MGFLDRLLGRGKEMAGGAMDTVGDVAEKAGDAAGDAADKAKDVADDAADRVRGRDDEQPPPGAPPA